MTTSGTDAELGVRIRMAREHAGMSKAALARAAGVADSTICALESGKRRQVREETAKAIAAALGRSAKLLFRGALTYRGRTPHILRHGSKNALQEARLAQNLTIKGLSTLAKVSYRTIVALENDQQSAVTLQVAVALALALHDTPAHLFPGMKIQNRSVHKKVS